ncbi:MAG: SDR family oxidoreductase [Thermohalobaculum sp.]|nr:SDR family oxidoreductase [Thermohalobaculum sp.]
MTATGNSAPDAPVVIVSGGSRGLGLALVELFLDRGWRVATFSRSRTEALDRVLEAHGETGSGRVVWIAADGQSGDDLKGVARAVAGRWSRLDALVNNAGTGLDGLLAMMRAEDIDRVLDVNLRGAILLTQACVREMIKRGTPGSIVNISSVNGVRGHSGVSVYSATKAALDGMARSLARELGPRGIRVNSVAPGYFESDMVGELSEEATARITRRTPLGRLAQRREIAEAVFFLASDHGSFITGQVLVVDGGLTC